MTKKTKKILLLVSFFLIFGLYSCSDLYAPDSKNPTERGLSYVAGAILGHAIIRSIF
jgi:hypothetical protein